MATAAPPSSGPALPNDDRPAAHLKTNALGPVSIAFLVIAAAAPLTVMAGVAPLAILVGGIGAPVGYLAAGAVLTVFAVGFTAMTRHTGGAGAFYSYVSLGLGRPLGMGAGIVAVLSYNALQIGVYGLLGQQASDALAVLAGVRLPWWSLVFVAIVVVWLVGRRGVDVGARILGVLLIAETAILTLLVVAVIVRGGSEGLSGTSFSAQAVLAPGMFGVLAFAFAAFMGFESTALYRPEARDPERTIPRATYGAVIFMGLFYCLVVWAVIQAYGNTGVIEAAGDDLASVFFVAIQRYVGTWAMDLMYLLIVTSVLASQIAFHNAINRYTFTLARDGLLPAVLARSHPRYGSPAVAGAVQSVLAAAVVGVAAIVGADPYFDLVAKLNTPGVVGIIGLQALTSAAVVGYFVRRRHTVRARAAVICAAAATVLLSVAVVVLVAHISLLTQTTGLLNVILVGMVPLVLAGGIVGALVLRRRRPEVYAGIGGPHPEDAHLPAAEPVDASGVRPGGSPDP